MCPFLEELEEMQTRTNDFYRKEKRERAIMYLLSFSKVTTQRRLTAKELMLLNCGAGEDS